MNKFRRMLMAGVLPALMMMGGAASAGAPPELTGIWQGKLAVDPKTSLTIQVTFAKDAKGGYTAVVDSPDNPAIKNTATSGVTWDGKALKFQVPSLSGSYAGTLQGTSLNGQWTQPGGNLQLVLAPYSKPVVTKAAASQITGPWFGTATVQNSPATMQLRIKADDKGVLSGTAAIPDRGMTEVPLSNLEFSNDELTFRIDRINAPYKGKLANGVVTGKLALTGPGIPPEGLTLNFKRGEFQAPVHALKITSEQFAKLNGRWNGKLEITNPAGAKVSLSIVMRFNTNANGQFIGMLDSPDQKAENIPITEATFTGDTVSLKVQIVNGEFKGTVSDKALTGTWTQGPNTNPLVLTKQ